MEFYGVGECIECNSAAVFAKKIEPSPPLNHHSFGKCIKYICKRDGEASIQKELSPKVSIVNPTISHLDLGDTIKANSFYVLVKGFKVSKIEKKHFSGSHNARYFESDAHTFAEISKPYSVGERIQLNSPDGYVSPLQQLL